MEQHTSTFENLVKSLSREEIQHLLEKISSSVADEVVQYEKKTDKNALEKIRVISDFNHEPMLFRFWFKIVSFFKSLSTEILYNQELIKRIGRELKRTSHQYININKGVYTKNFYEKLLELRKTQIFFSELLDSYNREKSNFYMILSSSTAPYTYNELIKASEVFEGTDVSNAAKNAVLRKIEKIISEMDEMAKADMYLCAQAIEWIKIFCDAPIEKALSKFDDEQSNVSCQIMFIQNEIELLASMLNSSKNIPVITMQALFLLHNIDMQENMEESSSLFIEDAKKSLSAVSSFKKNIPIIQIVRYTKQETDWEPITLSGGEDWALYFKHAWKERFFEKWTEWAFEQKKTDITKKMTVLLNADILESLKYKPWTKILGYHAFKRELTFSFLKTLFKNVYQEKMLPDLKVILTEGNFYRQENVSEYSNSLARLNSIYKEIERFEEMLSPGGLIGSGFASIKENEAVTIKIKNQMEALMRNAESEAKRIITYALNTLKSLNTILLGIISGSKTGIYATLTNLTAIQGKDNKKFQKNIFEIKKMISAIIDLIEEAEKLDSKI